MKRKILSILTVLTLCLSMLPVTSFAATSSWVGSSSYGWYANHTAALSEVKSLMAQQTTEYKMSRFNYILDEYPLSGYFNKSKNQPCDWHCGACGKVDSDSCMNVKTFYDKEIGKTVSLSSGGDVWQCAAFGNYCEYRFFGRRLTSSDCITVSASHLSSATAFKNYIASFSDLTGSHFRVNSPHSFTYLARTDTYIYFIDANSGYGSSSGVASGKCTNNSSHYSSCCKINLRRFTYSEFVNKYKNSNLQIYTTSTSSSGSSSDSTDVSIVSDYEKNTITDTNAILYAMVYKPSSYAVTKIGIKVRKDGSTYDKGWAVYQNPSKSYVGNTSMQPYFNMNTELGATLVPGTKYWLQFYAVVNGKEYWSPEYYFSTTGSPYTLTIKYDSNGGIISSDKYEITSDGLVKRLSDNSTKFHVVDYNEYDDFYNCGTFGLTKNGYKFAGWTVEDDSTVYDMNKSWYPEEIYPDLANGSATITAKAVWIPNTLTISYNANGGILSSSDEYGLNDDGIVKRLSDNGTDIQVENYGEYEKWGLYDNYTFRLQKDGYKFVGWTIDDGSIVYDMSTPWYPEEIYPDLSKESASITAYAVWSPNKLTINYNANGGTISSEKASEYHINDDGVIIVTSSGELYSQNMYYGNTVEWGFTDDSTLGVVKENDEFLGWKIGEDGEERYDVLSSRIPEELAPELKKYKNDVTITVYAVWKSQWHEYDNACDTTCNLCGVTREITHDYYSTTTVESTCTQDGKITYTCKVCGDSYEEMTGRQPHDLGPAEAEYYSEEYHIFSCLNCDHYIQSTHTWEYYENVEATCEADGYYHKYCTICKGELKGTVEALAHNYESTIILPTATSQGYTLHTCANCGDSYKDNYTPALVANGVKNMTVTASDTNIVVAWDALDGATKYNLYVNDAEGNNLITRALAADKTSVTLSWPSELEWDKTYTIGIRARTTKWLDTVYKTAALTVANRIVDVKTQSVGRTIKVDWRAYEGATQYYVYVYEKGAYPTTVTSVRATTNSATIINAINPEVDYEVRVIATKGVAKMATADALVIDARLNVFNPDTFVERGITPNKVAIGFDEVRGADKYWVYLTPVEGGETIVKASDRAIAAISGLAPNTTYNVQVQARIVDADGVAHYSGMSETLGTIATTDWEDINFTAKSTENGAKLTWTASANACKYIIYRSTNGGKSYKAIAAITDPSITSCVDTKAKSGYIYAIKAQLQDDFVTTISGLIKSEAIEK